MSDVGLDLNVLYHAASIDVLCCMVVLGKI